MAKTFRCADAGVVCGAKVSGATTEEVLEKAIAHARDSHGVDLTQYNGLAAYAASLVRDEGSEGER